MALSHNPCVDFPEEFQLCFLYSFVCFKHSNDTAVDRYSHCHWAAVGLEEATSSYCKLLARRNVFPEPQKCLITLIRPTWKLSLDMQIKP